MNICVPNTKISNSLCLSGNEQVTLTAEKPLPDNRIGSKYILRDVGLYVFVYLDNGITLQWDKSTRIYVRADKRWTNMVSKMEEVTSNMIVNVKDGTF